MILSIITISKTFDIHYEETIKSINNSIKANKVVDLEVISVISKGKKSEVFKFLDSNLNCRSIVRIGEDSSLFNAMNIGVKYSSYKYVWFINSGDFVYKKIDLKTFGEGKDLNYELQIDSLPEIKLKPFDKYKATEFKVKIEEKIINQILIKHDYNYYIPNYNTGVMFITDTRVN